MEKVYIVIVNYVNWQDTIECLETVFRSKYPNIQVLIVDNYSKNNSLEYIEKWVHGLISINLNRDPLIKKYIAHPVKKPLSCTKLASKEITAKHSVKYDDQLLLIQSDLNGGFAYGNNIALRYILNQNDSKYVWLLNNDTLVEPNTLSNLFDEFVRQKNKKVGIMGCKIMNYDSNTVQCLGGGVYYNWLGKSKLVRNARRDEKQHSDTKYYPLNIDFISGASMMVSTDFLKDVGLLEERYFLYFEEVDWALRAKRSGWNLGIALNATIYHKEGASISGNSKKRSKISDYYYLRNKLLITKRFFGMLNLVVVYLSFIIIFSKKLFKGEFDKLPIVLKALIKG